MATLCQIGEDGSITGRWDVGSQPLVVGRGEAADAHVEDEAVSRRHAVIQPEGDHYLIEDLGSQNGTWVDGRRLLTVRLHHKAQILVGRTQLVFLDEPPNKVVEAQAPQRLTGPRASVPPGAPPPSALNRSGVGLAKAA